MIIGIDEVGRGCWAGPLVAAAVALDDNVVIDGLKDSKKLSAKQRTRLDATIREFTSDIGIGWVHPDEITKVGLTKSVELAMRRAMAQLHTVSERVIIDGNINYLSDIANTEAIVKADDLFQAVSAASVVAKVARDSYMQKMGQKYPEFGFEKHVGYGTTHHITALQKYGVIKSFHRLNYKPIQAILSS